MSKKALSPVEQDKWRAGERDARDGTVLRIFREVLQTRSGEIHGRFPGTPVTWARLVLLPLLILSAALGVTWIVWITNGKLPTTNCSPSSIFTG